MKKNITNKIIDVLISNKNKALSVIEISGYIDSGSTSKKQIKNSIRSALNTLPPNCYFEKINDIVYYYYADDDTYQYIYKIKEQLIHNKVVGALKKKYKNEIFDIFTNIDKEELGSKVDIDKVIIPFIDKFYTESWKTEIMKSFSISKILPVEIYEEYLNEKAYIEEWSTKDPALLENIIKLTLNSKKDILKKWFNSKTEADAENIKEIKSKINKSFIFGSIFLLANILLFQDKAANPLLISTYIAGICYFLFSKDGLKKTFIFYLIYNVISNTDILRDNISLFPYETTGIDPDLRIYIFSFILLNFLLYFSYKTIQIWIMIKLYSYTMIINFLHNLQKYSSYRIDSYLKIYKTIKNIDSLESTLLYSFINFFNNLMNMDIQINLLKKDEKFTASTFKTSLFVFLLTVLMYSYLSLNYENGLFNSKHYIIETYSNDNNGFCKNIDKDKKIIKLKNGNVLVQENNIKNKFMLSNCNEQIKI